MSFCQQNLLTRKARILPNVNPLFLN
uniref:Uncharacterized protein n=1 Tax=Arundo donax TaxID=35708 RepID=A0A0A9HF37_ARUDO